MKDYSGKNIFLIGPARSGTKIIRDVIASHPEINKVPYDINYIWKYGNYNKEGDVLTTKDYDSKINTYIKEYLEKFRSGNNYLIEKTVGNTVRVPYIYKNFPEAKFIFLFRNGLDTIESVIRQWDKVPGKKYLFEKAKTVPVDILLRYGFSYITRYLKGQNNDNYYWGVDVPDLNELSENEKLEVKVATQWKYCVDSMLLAYDQIPVGQKTVVTYENIVEKPSDEFLKILTFINEDFNKDKINYEKITDKNKGKYKGTFTKEQIELISDIIKDSQHKITEIS
ncbi:sulfotransferase family protein [Gracilimonas sediminicola]|uniref:Sulfotransferase n=1 Tax=Gracilimonas sediminicola TaxID=2952158 RepID=A0A9X2RHG2_9BACT|nr:sulfotransferase [Gracilimonas sediminicola]MCP9292288.1 sulfotransferase [Gracilimonas sediminicola]